jgi:hypothetical protein
MLVQESGLRKGEMKKCEAKADTGKISAGASKKGGMGIKTVVP